jgi:hypothetical protein
MTLTGTWTTNPARTLVLKWTAGEAPVRPREKPSTPDISERSHHD